VLVTNPFLPGSLTRARLDYISKGWWILFASGVRSVVAGGIMVLTDWSIVELAFALGIVLVFSGVLTLFTVPIAGSVRSWAIVAGLLEVGVGIAVWTRPGPTLLVIATWIGWLLLFRGVTTISGAVVVRSFIPYRGLVLAAGIVEVAASLYLLARPGLTLLAAVLAIGLTSMFYGVMQILAAFEVKHLPRRLDNTGRTVERTTTRRLERATA
jgi:uncharacterized membrane protein HdeD (DUF308 family)